MDVFLDFLNRTLKTVLSLDPETAEKLGELEGKTLCLQCSAPDMTLYLCPGPQGLEISQSGDGEADVTLRGSALSFARLGVSGLDSTVVTDTQITMEGDVETGQRFQKILSRMDLDWEELVARYLGDTPARKAGNLVREMGRWASESADLSRQNTAEYLQEEKEILATPLAAERFRHSVNELRADVDRLEQRISTFRHSLEENT